MDLIDRMIALSTHIEGIDDFMRPTICEVNSEETGNIQYGLDRNTEHIVYLKVGVNFWANKAQYNTSCELAKKRLLQIIHKDILGISDAIRSAVMSGDAKQALIYVDQINKHLGMQTT